MHASATVASSVTALVGAGYNTAVFTFVGGGLSSSNLQYANKNKQKKRGKKINGKKKDNKDGIVKNKTGFESNNFFFF